ncbi:hypothetical protein [Schumannella sp. 10F1B-5-1]|uniref:hypothetical protein n=1 Tax=Schumannella sp. 10F1B-5-1 TaxID=2590780 RepID=UPI001130E760|nr:hypothetical protein [Schumannella sp. 10F1B-5-1]TPW73189.1 hypothetical protein FJ658_08115 [Schumannella sp. 10F1B-5-1]
MGSLQILDLTSASSVGAALDRVGIAWSCNADGDILVRLRRPEPQWIDAVFYEITPGYSIRGEFLDATTVEEPDGTTRWEVSPYGPAPTGLTQRIANLYVMPKPEGLGVQAHGSIEGLPPARPIRIKLIPGRPQIDRIEPNYPGLVGRGDSNGFWIGSGIQGSRMEDAELLHFVQMMFQASMLMFDGEFTGWVQIPEG